MWSACDKASLFSAHFDAKQCRNRFRQPHSCDPFPILCSVAFQSILFAVYFSILTVEMMLLVCFHFFTSRWLVNTSEYLFLLSKCQIENHVSLKQNILTHLQLACLRYISCLYKGNKINIYLSIFPHMKCITLLSHA